MTDHAVTELGHFEPEAVHGFDSGLVTYEIGGEADAEQALEALAELEESARRVSDQHARMVARYNDWAETQLKAIEERTDGLRGRLHRWMQARVEADPKSARTVRLPMGSVSIRKGQSAVEVDDAEAFMNWADRNGFPNLVRRPEPIIPPPTVDKRAVKSALGRDRLSAGADYIAAASESSSWTVYVTESGEQVPGVRLVRHPDTLHVSLDMDDTAPEPQP